MKSLTTDLDWRTKAALYLGSLAIITNLSLTILLDQPTYAAGKIFLFLAAGALGPGPALLAVGLGYIPETLLTGDHVEGARFLVLIAVLSTAANSRWKVPLYLSCALVWLLAFGPFTYYVGYAAPEPVAVRLASSMATAAWETFLCMVAGLLLLVPGVWGVITHKPRVTSLMEILTHLVPLIASVSVATAFSLGAPRWSLGTGVEALWSGLWMMIAAVLLPAAIGHKLASWLPQISRDLGLTSRLSNAAHQGFSGLSSEFWRRRSTQEADQVVAATTEFVVPKSDETARGEGEGWASGQSGLCALQKNGTIAFANRKFRDLLEIRHNELLGKRIDQIGLPPEVASQLIALAAKTLEKGSRSAEIKINQLPDTLRFFEVSTQRSDSLENSTFSGQPDCVLISLRDITERRTVENHLLQAQKLDSLGSSVSGLAHAFNNSLTAISGEASVATLTGNPEDMRNALSRILSLSKDAGNLVRQLLEFAEGQPTLLSVVDIGKLLSERLVLFREMIGEACEIAYSAPTGSILVRCDSHLLVQALANLVMNARESLHRELGRVEISLDTEKFDEDIVDLHPGGRAGTYCRIRVRDNGCGMTPEALSRAFDPLFSTKAEQGHAGLGLSIVFAIVRAHDGFLSLESKPERGTTVSIYLPLAQGIPQEKGSKGSETITSGSSSSPLAASAQNNERILVVEDEEILRRLMVSMLSTLGYQVQSCSDGAEALIRCTNEHYDLLLVDMILPKMHGLDLIAKIREQGRNPLTLLITGYGVNLRSTQESAVLPKPFDLTTLATRVREVLASRIGNGLAQSRLH